MNYYDELLQSIDSILAEKDYEKAKVLILNELNLPYVPRDIEDKLNNYLYQIKDATYAPKSLTEEDIIGYLNADCEKQLIGVDELGKKNLRDYIDVVSDFLKGDKYVNAKALLIDSLIRQEINYDFEYVNNGSLIKFNPSKLKIVEETDEFKNASDILSDYYLKNPSKLQIGLELIYKECLLALPNKIDSKVVANKIIKYIDDAFSAK